MSSVIALPMILESAPNWLRHMPSLRTTTAAAPRSPSLGSSVRPSSGFVVNTEKKFWVTAMVLASEGSPRPVRVSEWLARPAMALKTWLLSRNSSRLGYDIPASVIPRFGFASGNKASRPGSGYGSGRSRTASTTEKIAVFAPMPSASVKIATTVKPGDLRSMRSP